MRPHKCGRIMDVDNEALQDLRAAKRRYDEALPAWHRAIYAALLAGVRMTDVAAESGYNREHVRRIRVAGDAGEIGGPSVATPAARPAPVRSAAVSTRPTPLPPVETVAYSDAMDEEHGPDAEPFIEAP